MSWKKHWAAAIAAQGISPEMAKVLARLAYRDGADGHTATECSASWLSEGADCRCTHPTFDICALPAHARAASFGACHVRIDDAEKTLRIVKRDVSQGEDAGHDGQ